MKKSGRRLAKQFCFVLGLAGAFVLASFSSASADNDKKYKSKYNNYNNNYGYSDNRFVRCNSYDYNRSSCRAQGKIRSAYVYDRLSNSSCRKGRDWGYKRDYIWVTNGCRAVFKVDFYNYSYGGGYGYGNDNYGYGNDNYGYGNSGYGGGYGLSRDIAISNCIASAERQLYRDGFRYPRFDRVERANSTGNGWRIDLVFRVRHDNHYHYPVFGCNASRYDTRLTKYDFGQGGRQCGFNYRLSNY